MGRDCDRDMGVLMPKDSLYTKYFRFTATSPSTLTEDSKSGYGTITMAMDGNDIVITSSGEFEQTVNLDDTQNSSARWVSSSEIRFTPYPFLNWGTIQGEIVEK